MEINKVIRNKEFGELSVIVKDKKEYFEAIPVATRRSKSKRCNT